MHYVLVQTRFALVQE